MKYTEVKVDGFERVIKAEADDFLSFISVHNTALGPALGGTRFMDFGSEEQQLKDTNMLSNSMTYKNAMANANCGGGKATVALSDNPDTWKLFAEALNYLNKDGHIYTAAGDVGTGDKLNLIAEHTEFVAGHTCPEPSGVSTGYGVMQSLLGCYDFSGGDVEDAIIYINGFGKVGSSFARFANLTTKRIPDFQDPNIKDNQSNGIVRNSYLFNSMIYNCTVFAPCAMAHIVTPKVIDTLAANAIIVSGANNPEESTEVCQLAHDKGILFPPAWISNNGGIKVIVESMNDPEATYSSPKVKASLELNRKLTQDILQNAKDTNITPMEVALVMAKEIINK